MSAALSRLLCVLSLVFIAAPTLAREEGEAPPPPARPSKIRLLVVTGGHPFDKKPFFDSLVQPDIEVKHVEQPEAQKWFAPDKAGDYDVMLWYDFFQDINDATKKNIEDLLKKGKPLLALHHCLADYQDWPEMEKIFGGRYFLDDKHGHAKSTYAPNQKISVKIANPDHPITRFMKDFDIRDEAYGGARILPTVKPLLTTEHPESNKTCGWINEYGKSTVVYIQLGHDRMAYNNKNYRKLIAQTVRWLAGRLPDPAEKGFEPLFNGKNLEGWKVLGKPEGFQVTEGVIHSDSGKGGEWMRTEKEYGDYALRVEWKVGEEGNAGVFLRCLDKDKGAPWDTGSEVQISNEPRNAAHCTGSLYGSVSVDPRPDEAADVWHEFWIVCRGSLVTVYADNIPVIDVDSRTVPALAKKPLTGFIGLQDSHNPKGWIEYRKVLIKELKGGGTEKAKSE